ncbi:hypothetical protein IV102_19405 [bacterium]|nr:hypothetical protein [bacterium]
MQKVGIRELKSKLTLGEIIQVTKRGRVVAQLQAPGPLGEDYPPPHLLKAASEGKVRLAQQPPPPNLYEPRPLSDSEVSGLQILTGLRGDH